MLLSTTPIMLFLLITVPFAVGRVFWAGGLSLQLY